MFVYLITNLINGKRYVGQTSKSLEKRFRGHCIKSGCLLINRAIQKYGKSNFVIEPIIEVDTKDLTDEFEKEYIVRYCSKAPNGYNMTDGGEGILNPTEECRAKMRQGALNQKIEDKARGGRTQGLIQGKKNVESGLWAKVVSAGGKASGRSKSLLKMAANARNGERFGKWSVESGHLAAQRTPEHQSEAGRAGGNVAVSTGQIHQALHVRWHVKRDIVNPNCKFCKEVLVQNQKDSDGNISEPIEIATAKSA